uniref:G-protein coupled receptors family 1 profile domain-containing protein n=1 Tax=Sus scrofa TaxID=9823 RepID=A0A8D1UX44_PIG
MFFALFLGMYLTMVLGDLFIILLIRLNPHLHTPIYFFLSHLDLTDISFSSVTIPKMLINMQTQDQPIPYSRSISQTYCFITFANLDSFLITLAYDRYVAICHPLHYESECVYHAGGWVLGLTAIMLPFVYILISYGHIGANVLRVPSTRGICKALSTCGSHLSVVILYYGAIIGLYFLPSSNNTNDSNIIASLMYTVVTPMLNPFIYSLRNKDMKGAWRKLWSKKTYSSN